MSVSMALRLLSVLRRCGAHTVTPSVAINSCRFASRGASKPWMGQSHAHRDRVAKNASRYGDDEELRLKDVEDVEDKLQALADEGRKRQKTVKYHMLRRQMTPSGAPQRRLTWDAIEQIRYLKQEQPEEWTVERLAEGFSVTPDVILRVLRSKFVPTPERKVKQDAKIMAELSSQHVLPSGAGTGPDRLKLPGSRTPAVLPPGSRGGAVVPVADQTLMLRGEASGSLTESHAPVTQFRAGVNKDAAVNRTANVDPTEEEEEEEEVEVEEESWDGRVFTEEELEEFLEMKKPSPAVQVGKGFFDAEGNFLYRI